MQRRTRHPTAVILSLVAGLAGLVPPALSAVAAPEAAAAPPARVTVSAAPESTEVLAAACGIDRLEVTIANPSSDAVYADVHIVPEAPVETSREQLSTYVPAGGEVVASVEVRASVDVAPGTYEVEFRVGRHGRVQDEVAVTVVPRPSGPGANLALGGPVEASSTHGNFSACGAVDGNANNADWSVTTGWNDGTRGVFPDWLAVRFTDPQQVGRVVLYTRPRPEQALRDWDVQVQSFGEWTTVASVRGNTGEVVTSEFEPVTTSAVRIHALASGDGAYSRIVELEIFAE